MKKKTALFLAVIILISAFCASAAYADVSGLDVSGQEPYSSPDAEDPGNTAALIIIAVAAVSVITAAALVIARRKRL